ncbi:helix-turn-helix transcriptional regulator [Clostridium sp.]|uniref:helix-turn-helix transcriptional regulator n=1 Tax=Clostridium sp. TaxID=1506 RepID=UPI003D6C7C44
MSVKKTKVKNNLKQILSERGIMQIEIINDIEISGINISKSTMSNICNNRYDTSMELGFKIARILNLGFEDIFFLDEE